MYGKRESYRNKKILQSAKDEQCTMRTTFCNQNPQTVVAAHSNWSEDGKGMGIKADDCFIAYCCSGCHSALDQGLIPNDEARDLFHRAMKLTWRRLLDKGILK
jgi:hypothetical protein